MTTRPILFSGPMVRALLNGTKTQTRRVVQPMSRKQAAWLAPALLAQVPAVEVGSWDCGFGVALTHPGGGPLGFISCPYGAPGDELWVRETWAKAGEQGDRIEYRADSADPLAGPWRPSIFMPRWASRLTLRVTAVRVERLQDISEADAVAEGVEPVDGGWRVYDEESPPWLAADPRFSYRSLWESINGAGSWAANPWVWVVGFEVAP